MKWDGFRAGAVRRDGEVRLWSRHGKDFTAKFPDIQAALEAQLTTDSVLDGELVVWTGDRLDFDALQQRMVNTAATVRRPARRAASSADDPGDPGRESFERALAGIRAEYRDRITAIGERQALAYLAIHRQLKMVGTSIDPPDALMAATAIANGWTLESRNIKYPARTRALTLNPWEYQA